MRTLLLTAGDTRDVEFGLHSPSLSWARTAVESVDSSFLVRLLGVASPLPDEEGLYSEK
jgi:hypothetical protein